jgi:hypothetical protein
MLSVIGLCVRRWSCVVGFRSRVIDTPNTVAPLVYVAQLSVLVNPGNGRLSRRLIVVGALLRHSRLIQRDRGPRKFGWIRLLQGYRKSCKLC